MHEWFSILLTGVTAAIVSTALHYFFQLKIERRKKDEKIIRDLYGPIFNILGEKIIIGEGYQGIDQDQLKAIRNIMDKNPFIVDRALEEITYNFLEKEFTNLSKLFLNQIPPINLIFDEDRKLLEHVLFRYNEKRKALGLPFDEAYLNIRKLHP
ncbi:hypothetical protein E2R51_03670 [Jeotgalibacillus sp. S-D1]|uniref:hypothetical protein n=1 Tax=Jeotgalibacillus sp. S-D1 TaxID=2552189 RepID=UPI00105A194F|nr:hypothetical protein [Jeotgalibacillus sp. S-D1]TDL34831.1 hypothetical protein E2R51_03670 [Jeotgalibacillus sp. S-D1]